MKIALILPLLSLLCVGCTNSQSKCGDKFSVLWPDAEGQYDFRDVHPLHLDDPYQLKSADVEVFYEGNFDSQSYTSTAAQPHMTSTDNTCVPDDVGSSIAISAFLQFERLAAYERLLGTADQLTWPRHVGVETLLNDVPTVALNNAHYFGEQDLIALVPYDRSHLPMALNHGVVAHEHFHAHFQSQVIGLLDQVLQKEDVLNTFFSPMFFYSGPGKATVANLDGWDLRTPIGINNFILRGWNEGLADFFAAVYTGQPDFFSASLPDEARGRNVALPVQRLPTAVDFQELSKRPDFKSQVYGQGAFLARLLYRLAFSGTEPAEATLQRVMKNLKKLPSAMMAGYQRGPMEFASILPVILEGFQPNVKACLALQQGVSEAYLQEHYSVCEVR